MSCGNVVDLRRVQVEHTSEKWENGSGRTECANTPLPGPNRPLDFDLTEGASRLMADSIRFALPCPASRAARHTGGA